ncbi:MAG: putative 4-hydroxybenzoate polyprenyltransferase [Thermoleophilia bacterium]|nr:putative 4-hydroxybenzoate polyprenyltransferase [Thermoleophilia bacterium]
MFVTYVRRFASLIKFEHSIFALPFAYSAAFLAEMRVPGFWRMFWITVAMVAARSFAMALNRLIDAEIDARNPRTAGREIPAGLLKKRQVWVFALASLAVLVWSTFNLPVITRYLWPAVVVPMVIYPYTKRWTWLCHLVLGFTDALGPMGAWVAVTGVVTWEPLLIGIGVTLWIAGFDVIYSFMDIAVDRAQGLHSIPADFGERAGLWSTRVMHVLAVVFLALAGWEREANLVYYLGVAACAILLFYENWLMRKAELEKVGVAFMTMNGIISVVFLFFTTLSLFVL